jgi:hypothetical protein
MITRDTAQWLLQELDDLAVRVAVQERRRPGDREVMALRHDITDRRDLVIAYLAWLREADVDAATLH